MRTAPFQDRADAGRQLAELLRPLPLQNTLVLAIPRGGVEVAAPIALALGAELDLVFSRKLRAPDQPELALGAVSEAGDVYLTLHGSDLKQADIAWIDRERDHQVAEMSRRARNFRSVRPRAPVAGRSVIVTDDGIATGSTMIAALRTVRAEGARELIVAVPVAPRDRLAQVESLCDRVVCLHIPQDFRAIGQFYRDFAQVSDERVIELLRATQRPPPAAGDPAASPAI